MLFLEFKTGWGQRKEIVVLYLLSLEQLPEKSDEQQRVSGTMQHTRRQPASHQKLQNDTETAVVGEQPHGKQMWVSYEKPTRLHVSVS